MGCLAHPPMIIYPVLLIHDLPLPLHQACCRAAALPLWLRLEGSFGLRVVALRWGLDKGEILRGQEMWQPPSAVPYFGGHGTGSMGRGVGPEHWGLLHTSLSIRSFFSCSKEMTSTSARARGSRQMSSAGTWRCQRHRKGSQEGNPKRDGGQRLLNPTLAKTLGAWGALPNPSPNHTQAHAHLLQQGLHLPLLALLLAPIRVTLQAIKVGFSSP